MNELPQMSISLRRVMLPLIFFLSAAMLVVVLAQVLFRYVLSQPLPWSEELARYLMIWVACLAASEAYAKGSHVGVDLVIRKLKPKLRKGAALLIHLLVIGLMGVVAYYGFKLSFAVHSQLSPAMEVPMTYPYLAVPVGAALILIQAVGLFIQQVSSGPQEVAA
jgi:TRAP-type C4-dicarboxylate transport system permease small subunit